MAVTNGIKASNVPSDANKITQGAPDHPIVSKARRAFNLWRESENAFKNMSTCSQDFSEIEEAMSQYGNMKNDIETKNKEITDLKCTIRIQSSEWADNYLKWEKEKGEWDKERRQHRQQLDYNKSEVQSQVKTLLEKQETKHAQEIVGKNKNLNARQEMINSLNKELEEAKAKTRKIEEIYTGCSKQLEQWEKYTSSLQEIDFLKLGDRMKKLFAHCCIIANKHFFRDLPEHHFTDPIRWEDKVRSLSVPLSLPPTNSSVAKHIRMAACLYIVGKKIAEKIFRPCFKPESDSFSKSIKELLARQYENGAAKERVTRALLLSTYESRDISAAIDQAVQDATAEVQRLLAPIGADESFRTELEHLLYDAADLWKEAQHSTKMVDVSMTDGEFNEPWPPGQLHDLNTTIVEIKSPQASALFGILPIFPSIYVAEDETEVYAGFALYPDQNIVVAAQNENSECVAARRPSRGGLQGRPAASAARRLSVRLDGNSGTGAEDTPPRLDPKRPPQKVGQGAPPPKT